MSGTDRRGFLRLLAAAAAGHVLDVDKLLWIPGAKTWFVPPAPTFKPTLLTCEMITREALEVFRKQLEFTKKIDRYYDGQFMVRGARVGATINVRKPQRYA